jgi:hypothetical protein
LLESNEDFDAKAYLLSPSTAGSKPSKFYKARSALQGLAKATAGASQQAFRVQMIYGDKPPSITSGRMGGHFTKGGRPILHPGAYSKIGWSNMQYLTNSEVVTVGLDWLYRRLPKAVETYLRWKGIDDPHSNVTHDGWRKEQQTKAEVAYATDDPILGENCHRVL